MLCAILVLRVFQVNVLQIGRGVIHLDRRRNGVLILGLGNAGFRRVQAGIVRCCRQHDQTLGAIRQPLHVAGVIVFGVVRGPGARRLAVFIPGINGSEPVHAVLIGEIAGGQHTHGGVVVIALAQVFRCAVVSQCAVGGQPRLPGRLRGQTHIGVIQLCLRTAPVGEIPHLLIQVVQCAGRGERIVGNGACVTEIVLGLRILIDGMIVPRILDCIIPVILFCVIA